MESNQDKVIRVGPNSREEEKRGDMGQCLVNMEAEVGAMLHQLWN